MPLLEDTLVIHGVKMNLDANTFLSPLRLITTVSYFKIVQALTKHYLYSIQLKLELDVLNIEK